MYSFAEAGYRIGEININNFSPTDSWNCLGQVADSKNHVLEQIDVITKTLIQIPVCEKDDFLYGYAAGSLLNAILARIVLGSDFPRAKKSIQTLTEIINHEEGLDHIAALLNKDTLRKEEFPCLESYFTFDKANSWHQRCVLEYLRGKLSVFKDDRLMRMLSADNGDVFEALFKEPCVCVLHPGDSHGLYEFANMLFLEQLFMHRHEFLLMEKLRNSQDEIPVTIMVGQNQMKTLRGFVNTSPYLWECVSDCLANGVSILQFT